MDAGKKYTLLDVGSGLGDFISFLQEMGVANLEYTGIDRIREMVDEAGQKYPGHRFIHADFINSDFNEFYDYIICSGALNIIRYSSEKKHLRFIKSFIKKMYHHCNVACSFNLLSKMGKEFFPGDENFYYADHNDIFQYCFGLCENTEYELETDGFTFTVCMFKN